MTGGPGACSSCGADGVANWQFVFVPIFHVAAGGDGVGEEVA